MAAMEMDLRIQEMNSLCRWVVVGGRWSCGFGEMGIEW